MECKNEHFCHIFFCYFRKGKHSAHAPKKLRDVYGEEDLKDRQCRNWFDKFRSGDFSLKDEQLDIWIPHELKEIHVTKRIKRLIRIFTVVR